MCTVTYLPSKSSGFMLTSSRDEKILRASALHPENHIVGSNQFIYPEDPSSKGTWIVASDQGLIVCLLNGAFKSHLRKKQYRHSRGLVPIHYFDFKDVYDFFKHYNFQELEPFTLIIVEKNKLFEVRWDGVDPHLKNLAQDKAYIWSSVTLYNEEVTNKRELWFHKWLEENSMYTAKDIINFHKNAGDGDSNNNVLMNRQNKLQTVSITSVTSGSEEVAMVYEDLLMNVQTRNQIKFKIIKANI